MHWVLRKTPMEKAIQDLKFRYSILYLDKVCDLMPQLGMHRAVHVLMTALLQRRLHAVQKGRFDEGCPGIARRRL